MGEVFALRGFCPGIHTNGLWAEPFGRRARTSCGPGGAPCKALISGGASRHPMEFRPTEEMELVRKSVREFAEREIKPIARDMDATGEFPSKTVGQLGELGLLGMLVPAEYGGSGASTLEYAVAVEELARVDGSHALVMAAHNSLCTGNILIAADEAQKRKYVPPLASGRTIGAWALTEPSVGSDAAGMKTTAVREGDGWALNVAKNFCTNAPVAGTFVITAKTDPVKGA